MYPPASFEPLVSPQGILSIFGANLGPPVGNADYDTTGNYPTLHGNTTVTLNGKAAPLLFISPDRINAVAPSAVASQKEVRVVVSRYGESSAPFTVAVSPQAPAILSYTPQGSTQGAPLNFVFPNYSPNTADNPAAPGSAVVLFATGIGPWNPEAEDAGISIFQRPYRAQPVALTVGGRPARILYAGLSPYQTIGMLQINAELATDTPPGIQPAVLTVGGRDNASQQFTLAIK